MLALLLLSAPPASAAAGEGSLFLLVLFVVLAIGVSFLCSIFEAVLLSVTPSYVAALEERGSAAGARLRKLKDNVDRPLAAILSLNTVAHTVGATGAGAQAAALWGGSNVWVLSAVGAFSAVLTLGILVLSEIIPKTLGAVYWRGLAPFVARALKPLIWITYPLVLLSQGITKLIARGKNEGQVSRDELVAMANLGVQEGVFDEQESQILTNLLRFKGLTARDVMTPRTVLVAYPESTPLGEIAADDEPFSRLPLFEGDRDHVTGLVLRDEVLEAVADGRGGEPASALAREILTVPDSLPLPRLFNRLLQRRQHLALVVGEYGGTAGVATMEDVIETLLGLEIVDEVDDQHDMQVVARQRWAERAERLGLTRTAEADVDEAAKSREGRIKLGLTGGVTPFETGEAPSSAPRGSIAQPASGPKPKRPSE